MTTNLEDYAACLQKAAPEVTETFEATFHDAARLMSPAGLHEYMEGAKALCNLGRGPDVVTAAQVTQGLGALHVILQSRRRHDAGGVVKSGFERVE